MPDGLTGDTFVYMLAAAGVAYAFSKLQDGNRVAQARGETLSSLSEQMRTAFKRIEDIEDRQDDHDDEQKDIREAVILQGSHIETLVTSISHVMAQMEAYFGGEGHFAPHRRKLSPAQRGRSAIRRRPARRSGAKRQRRAA